MLRYSLLAHDVAVVTTALEWPAEVADITVHGASEHLLLGVGLGATKLRLGSALAELKGDNSEEQWLRQVLKLGAPYDEITLELLQLQVEAVEDVFIDEHLQLRQLELHLLDKRA